MRLLEFLAPLAVAAAFVPAAEAQCFGPDGLSSPACCAPATLDLPPLPPISMVGQGDRWDECGLSAQACRIIEISPPMPTLACGSFLSDIEILDCGGNSLMRGELTLDYTRTWEEQGGFGGYQVWRFAAKVDFEYDGSPVPPGSQIPNSLLEGVPTAFYYGYVDYALDCATGIFENSVVLHHGCDLFQHMPIYSTYPGVFDPTTSFAIVGPDTLANPFVPSLSPMNDGDVVGEAIRRIEAVCLAEDRIAQGLYQKIVDVCMCPLTFLNPQMSLGSLEAASFCGNSVRSLNVFPTLPYLHTVTTSLGRWSTSNSYPGPEAASVIEGLFQHIDTCPTSGTVEISIDNNYGGVTRGGFPAFSSSITPNNSTFIDMASNFSWLIGTPLPLPIVGEVKPTRHLTYINY